ncbi:MAG: hypothetical protein ACFN0Y_00185 [Lactobacillus sp.]
MPAKFYWPWLHYITYHGVIAAFAILIIACFLGQAWGYQVNPNLKFGKSSHFQKSVFMILIAFAVLDLVYNSFNDAGKQIWTVFFKYSVAIKAKYLTIPSFTAALEPGILE